MFILDTSSATWRVGRKTRPLRAKPMVTLLVDKTVMSRFLVDTLEAREPVSADAMFCIGESNDAWQQSAAKLLQKYDVTSIDAEGWMVCTPKPENSVDFFEVTADALSRSREVLPDLEGHYLQGIWGMTIEGFPNLQRVAVGDFVARNRQDHTDQWVVRRSIWQNTYSELSQAR